MCGIAGFITDKENDSSFLTDALKRLEYRGYDSAGLAVLVPKLLILKSIDRVESLSELVKEKKILSKSGIAHTRWATHGKPSTLNAHPHSSSGRLAVVHNGIIENYLSLKKRLISIGYNFISDTDTEVIVHLIHFHLISAKNLFESVKKASKELTGSFAFLVIDEKTPLRIIAVHRGNPIIVGYNNDTNYIASDVLAMSGYAENFIYLKDGDITDITAAKVNIYDSDGNMVARESEEVISDELSTDLNGFEHYMLKEIYEQVDSIQRTIQGAFAGTKVYGDMFGPKIKGLLEKVKTVQIIACGTSYHAGLVAKHWIEPLSGKLCLVDVASEYRYRTVVVPEDTLVIAISQSGETADTLSALQIAKSRHVLATLAICNIPTSTLVRETDGAFITQAGFEIGVASTKAFTTQLVGLFLFSLLLSDNLPEDSILEMFSDLLELPQLCRTVLKMEGRIKLLAEKFVTKEHAMYLGRGLMYPIALEGALKLKEISYIHAEAYPAGELKHGPLALIDEKMPVIVIAPDDELDHKLKSNIEEVKARGGDVFVFSENRIIDYDDAVEYIQLPKTPKNISPIIYVIPLQLLAYHVALLKGKDIDKPRNLAKSVTVE